MSWRILLALVVLTSTASAQPVLIPWRPPAGCTNGQAIVYNSSTGLWQCGSAGVTNSAGANVIVKSDGTNLVASSWTDAAGVSTTTGNLAVSGTTALTGLLTATAGGTTSANWTTTGTGDLVSADDLTVGDDATITDALTVNGNVQLGNASTDRVGIGTIPNSDHPVTFSASTGPKIALFPSTSTTAYGFGMGAGAIQYFTSSSSGKHSFGYGDSDAFTETIALESDGDLVATGIATITGLLTATAGVTTPANLTTTGTGDLVVADDATIGDDLNISTGAGVSPELFLKQSGQVDWKIYGVASSNTLNIWNSSSGTTIGLSTGAITLAKNTTVSGTLGVTGAADFDSTINVDGAVTMNADVTVGDANTDTLTITAKIDSHVHTTGTAPTLSAGCGTSATVVGNDVAGMVHAGTASMGTLCTVTFASAYSSEPVCVITSRIPMDATVDLFISAKDANGFSVGRQGGGAISTTDVDIFDYVCVGL